jgi:acetyl esterase/lipase
LDAHAARLTAFASLLALVAVAVPSAGGGDERLYSVVVSRNIAYGAGPARVMDVYRPAAKRRVPAVVFVHGGGFEGGDKAEWSRYAADAAAHGFVGVAINFRLAPTRPWHAPLDDVAAAVDYVRARADEFAVDPYRIAVGGASSGATLALDVVARHAKSFAQAAFGWSGVYDLDSAWRSVALRHNISDFTGGCPNPTLCVQRFSDASAVANITRGAPPSRLVGSAAELVPKDQIEELARALRDLRVPVETRIYPGGRHGTGYGAAEWPATLRFLARKLG